MERGDGFSTAADARHPVEAAEILRAIADDDRPLVSMRIHETPVSTRVVWPILG